MAKWVCRCGHTIQSSGDIPHPYQWLLYSDVAFDAYTGSVDADAVYLAGTHAYRCPSCDRLHVFWQGYEHDHVVYAPEYVVSAEPG